MSFPTTLEYCPPSESELEDLVQKHPNLGDHEINNPNANLDNRTAIRVFLRSRGVTGLIHDRLVEPYDLGFYKKCDGKSSPVYRISSAQKKLGFKRDIVSVRHDLDYYRGHPSRRISDWFYVISQIAIGEVMPMAYVEWTALRLFGKSAWVAHRERTRENVQYGQNNFILELPDCMIHDLIA